MRYEMLVRDTYRVQDVLAALNHMNGDFLSANLRELHILLQHFRYFVQDINPTHVVKEVFLAQVIDLRSRLNASRTTTAHNETE